MSMPIFLDNCPYDHMPNGSKNEWNEFYQAHMFELEANAFFPLFWNLLFSQNDIKHAKYIDDFDIDDQQTEVERQEYLEEFGETTYPYFIVSQADALKNLKLRKQTFLDIFGQTFTVSYEYFQQIIEKYYGEYILLRTNGLPLDEHSEASFRKELSAYELLGQTTLEQDYAYWQTIKLEMQKYKDLSYFLYGTNDFEQFSSTSTSEQNPNDVEYQTTYKDLPDYVYWIFGILIGIPTVYVWFNTHSWLSAFITFSILAAIFSFITIKLTDNKK